MFGNKTEDSDIDIDQPIFARPKHDGLDALCQMTHYNKKELKLIYQGFKQECPNGYCSEEEFVNIFSKYFPQGDATKYAHFVFNTLRPMCDPQYGCLDFGQFIKALSTLSRGTLKEKLNWIFNLYDIDRDGYISKNEMYLITNAIYELLGECAIPLSNIRGAKEHADLFFHKIDLDKDGLISFEEFVNWCKKDSNRLAEFQKFDTVI
ncbi:Kv channel-interacting protein 4-like [Dermatophagoides pteronyssinus]|uniref:Kv channel-interacting protein 4-like n=2 Tax=Dermatophagoides pteronyssinus TaxID=6956 RepID=A0A6P6Y6L7_DERPT|nr:Kv channel-interacting protein 4-like [Dermatophagoides pteronyssinus]KAH9418284.1 Kv channel-interacting protein 4 [Dermatophagoides pteronyssinus]